MRKNDNEMTDESDDLRAEYDFASMPAGVRGKYAEAYDGGANVVLLDPDVAKAFPTGESVNEALRLLIEIAERGASDQSK